MAVTSNSYTGNGSTTNYSITFPYINTTDIKAQIDGVATTAFSLANATTVAFNSAPGNNTNIVIYRETDDTTIPATFYAGSSIRSEDLNNNFTQTLYIGQETAARAISSLGGTMTGDLAMGQNSKVLFEGTTDDAHETTLTVTNPTADRTITLPNVTGTVVTTGDTATVTSTMIANGTIVGADIAADTITHDKLAANSVTAEQLSNDAVDIAAIQDDAVTNAKIAANAVESAQIANNSVIGNKIPTDAIGSSHISASAVTTVKIADDSVNTAKLAANAVTTTEITDGAVKTAKITDGDITTAKIANGAITATQIADNAVTHGKMADNSVGTAELRAGEVTLAKLAADSVDASKIAANSIGSSELANNSVGAEHLAANSVTTSEIADAELTTLAGMQAGTASILASGTALTSTTAELNLLDGKSIVTSVSGSSTDVQLPSAKAVNDQILAVTNALGGFVAIANETSFPTANPDPSNGAGTVVSISDAGGVVVNGSGVASITNGAGSGNTVTINGFPSSLHSKTLAAGVGLQVQTTSTLHTYDYHKLLAKEADVEQLSGDINDFNERYRIAANAPGSDNDEGDLWFDTNSNKMKVYDGSAWGDVASTGSFYILTLSSYSGTGGNSASFNGSAYRFTLSNTPNSAEQLIVSINGVVQKPNAGSSQPSEGFAISGSSIIFSNAPASGSDFFIVLIGASVSIGTPSNNTVTEAILQTNVVSEEKLKVDNSPTNDYVLTAKSSASGGLTWAEVVGAVADGCIYENSQTISNNYTIASGKGAHSVGPITVNATVTVNGNWVVS